MPQFDERRLGTLTVRIDRDLCVGFGDCLDLAPQVFALDEDGVAIFLAPPGEIDTDHLVQACDACPVDAIEVFGVDGRQLVP
jgi:ferredoxin